MGNIEMTVNVTVSVNKSRAVGNHSNSTNFELEQETIMATQVIRATPRFIDSDGEKALLLLYLLANTVVSLSGNTLLATAVCATKSLRKIHNIFYLNLAVADLLMVVVMVLATVSVFGERFWYIDSNLCDAWLSLESCAASVVVLSIEALTANIHLQISTPLRYNRLIKHRCLVLAIVLCIWLLSIGCSVVPILLRWHQPPNKQQLFIAGNALSKCHFSTNVLYAAVKTAVFVLHCSVILGLNARLYFYARNQRRQIQKFESVSSNVAFQLLKNNSSLPHSMQKQISFFGLEIDSRRLHGLLKQQSGLHRKLSNSYANVHSATSAAPAASTRCSSANSSSSPFAYVVLPRFGKSKRLKAIKTLTIMLLNFFICWFPFHIATMVNSACFDCVSDDVDMWLTMLAFLNASTNPIIYTICNKELRQVLHKLVRQKRAASFITESRSTHSFECEALAPRRSSQDIHQGKLVRAHTQWTSIEFVLRKHAKNAATSVNGSVIRRSSSCSNLL